MAEFSAAMALCIWLPVNSSHGHVVTRSIRHKSTHQSCFFHRVNSSQCRYTRRSTSHDFRRF